MTIRRFAPITVVGPNVETGIMVGAGDLIEVSTTGLVDLGGAFGGIGAPILTADGDTYPPPPTYPAPDLRKNSLIVGVRSHINPHVITWRQGGVHRSFNSPDTGTVVLRANDEAPGDNSRGWAVSLTVTSPDLALGGSPLLAVGRIEVVQSVQRADNSIPLLAGKRTLIRVFVNSGRTDSMTVPVQGEITVRYASGATWTGAATGTAYREGSHDRNDYGSSLNFRIPPVAPGATSSIRIEARVRLPGEAGTFPGGAASATAEAEFEPAPVVAIQPFLISLMVEGRPAPNPVYALAVLRDVQQRFPLIEGAHVLAPRTLNFRSPFNWEALLWLMVTQPRPATGFAGQRDYVNLALLAQPAGDARGGIAVYHPLPASAVVGLNTVPSSDAEICAHEVGHALGLNHVADCGAGCPWSAYLPRLTEEPGWYARESRMVSAGVGEMMSYCRPQWPSVTAYRYLLNGRHP